VSALYGDEGGKDSERINFDEITKISRQLHEKLDDQVDDKNSETHLGSLQAAPEVQKPIGLVNRNISSNNELLLNVKYEDFTQPQFGPNLVQINNQMGGNIVQSYNNAYIFHAQRINQNFNDSSLIEPAKKKSKPARKIIKNKNALDVGNYTGPFGKYENEVETAEPSLEDKAILDEYLAKMKKKGLRREKKEIADSFQRHESQTTESLLAINSDFYALDFKKQHPKRCDLPKESFSTLENNYKNSNASNRSINKLLWLPKSGHMLLACSADSVSRIYRVGAVTKHVGSYIGHTKSIKDAQFNTTGANFITASYDTSCKLWDTETGKSI